MLEEFVELSSSDESAALALTTLEEGSATSCLSQSTWLRFAEVNEIHIDGDSAQAELKSTTVAEPVSVTVDLRRSDDTWRIDPAGSMLVTVEVLPAAVPSQVQVGTCAVEVIGGTATVVLPPGEFAVSAADPTGVVEPGLDESFAVQVHLPGAKDVSIDLNDAPLSIDSLRAIDEAIQAAEEACQALEFTGPSCPPGAVGADSSEGSSGLNWDEGISQDVVDGVWMFTTAPNPVRYGFEGEDSWTEISVAYSGILVSGGEADDITASIMDVTSP